MSEIGELKRILATNAQDIASMLLPGGRKERDEWRAGDVSGEKGQSLGVHLTGAKAGIWADFSTGETGDLIDLWMACHGVDLPRALEEIRAHFGIKRHEPHRDPRPAFTRPPRPPCRAPEDRVLAYLTGPRKLPRDVIERFKVGEDGLKIIFPFLLPDGTLAMAKSRAAMDGADPKPTAANCEAVLFGWQAMPDNERTLVITEGEIDALSMSAYGLSAMSVPYGGGGKGKQNWIENEYDRLERFERILLATDMDEPGEQAAAEIAARLGRHRCYRVKLPRKDANQCLVDGISRDEIHTLCANAESLDPEGLRRAGAYQDRVTEMFWPSRETKMGYSLPYAGVRGKLLFRPAELTLWSGATGDGKSQIISDCIPCWIGEGSRVCLASFEMKPEQTLKRMVKQTGGVDRPTAEYIREIIAYLDVGLLLYEKVGKADVDTVLAIFDYARAKYGCDQFVIDSLMRLGIASDDYTAQEQAVFKIIEWAVKHNVHVHLVAHSRKAGKDRGAPETEDVKGAMEIGANAANVLTIWRNRKVEDAGGDPDNRPDMTDDPGVVLNIAKQRNGDFEGKAKLYFHTKTYQYFAVADNRRTPRSYVEFSRQAEMIA